MPSPVSTTRLSSRAQRGTCCFFASRRIPSAPPPLACHPERSELRILRVRRLHACPERSRRVRSRSRRIVAGLKHGQGRWKHLPTSANVIPSAARDLLFLRAGRPSPVGARYIVPVLGFCSAVPLGRHLAFFRGRGFSPDITALPTCSSFRTEQADFFFPFTPVKGSACAERNLSALSSPHPATFISAIPSLPSKTAPNLIHPQRAPDPPLPVILNPSDKDG